MGPKHIPGAGSRPRIWGDEFMAVEPGKRAWPMRHPAWSGPIAIVALLAAIVGCGNSSNSKNTGSATADPTPRPTATSAVGTTSSLVCHANAVVWRPADHTIAKIRVRTVAGAQDRKSTRL